MLYLIQKGGKNVNIYKLFYSNKTKVDLDSLTTDYINGASQNVFGVRIYPEYYREFMNMSYNFFRRNKIQQNIMTDFKFIELIKQQNSLNIEVADISFINEEEIIKPINENYELLTKALGRNDINQILFYLNALVNEGATIFKLDCYIKIGNKIERFNIYRNGTVSFNTNPIEVNRYTRDYKLLDFMVKGPEVFA